MTVVVPEKIPLEMPPGNLHALEDLALTVAGVAQLLAVLGEDLAGPGTSAPAWLGADAAAAAQQVTAVAGLAREMAGAVLRATGRLSAHADRVAEARRAIGALREEQDEDCRSTWRRLYALEGLQGQFQFDGPEAVAIVDEWRAGEAARRRRHEALLTDVADDAAATVRALGEAGAVVGGTGRPGDEGRAAAHLAALLPGWGDAELSRRGSELAEALTDDDSDDDWESLSTEAMALAGSPAFATALLAGLGTTGVQSLLLALGGDAEPWRSPVAQLLAATFGTAAADGSDGEAVAAVLGATYISERHEAVDVVAAGMVAVLAAGSTAGARGLAPATAAGWARQLLLAERSVERPLHHVTWRWPVELRDPVAVALENVSGPGAPEAAAGLFGHREVWERALARPWDDGGVALGHLVAVAGRDDGAAGDRAVRLGLETIGADLVEGDPDDRSIDRNVVEAVSRGLAVAAAAHVHVVADALASTASGGENSDDLLKGLGYVTVDRQAATDVQRAITEWAADQSHALTGTSRANPLPAVAVPAAYLAVQEYGQRLNHALDAYELQDEAEDRAAWWDWTGGLLLEVVSYVPAKPIAVLADVANAYAPLLLDMDGTWEQGPDRGLRFDADMAADRAVGTLAASSADRAVAVAGQAEASYRRVADRLGDVEAPESKGHDWLGATTELLTDGMTDAALDELKERAGREGTQGRFGGLLPGRK